MFYALLISTSLSYLHANGKVYFSHSMGHSFLPLTGTQCCRAETFYGPGTRFSPWFLQLKCKYSSLVPTKVLLKEVHGKVPVVLQQGDKYISSIEERSSLERLSAKSMKGTLWMYVSQ